MIFFLSKNRNFRFKFCLIWRFWEVIWAFWGQKLTFRAFSYFKKLYGKLLRLFATHNSEFYDLKKIFQMEAAIAYCL